jgi:hypothetical protein
VTWRGRAGFIRQRILRSMAREAGWATAERNRVFEAVLVALRAAGLPATPVGGDYREHRILVLEGPGTWLRYFLWAEPAPNRLSVGFYIPKGQYGAAVHTVLLREGTQLAQALGGPILQHKEVQREFRHFVRRDHRYRPATDGDAVRWCVEKIRAAYDLVGRSATLRDPEALRAVEVEVREPTDDPALLEGRATALLAGGEMEKPAGTARPQRRPSPAGEMFVRNPAVVAFVRQRAKGRCEACRETAPFVKDDGSPFLETHHLIRLADDGPDTVENAVAVCPNCHRRLHHGADRLTLAENIRARLFPL